MNKLRANTLFLSIVAACGGAPPEPAVPTAAPSDQTSVEVVQVPVAPEPEPVAPSAEQLAASKQRTELENEHAKMRAEHELEVARFTPEIHAQAQALADKKYASTRAGLAQILKSAHRKPKSAPRDAQRHPTETLEFLGVTPKQTVLEYGPGEGWYTELLAPLLAKEGKLIATSADPNGPIEQRGTLYGQTFKLFLETSPEAYGKVETAVVNGADPALPAGTQVDTVLVFRGLHGMVNQGNLGKWLAVFHGALKDKGVLGIEQHRAKPDAVASESSKQGYLPEAWVIAEIEKAGFKLQKKSEINANPKDTKDYPDGVWDLPPSFRKGDVDHDKYATIGESDRMTLRFVKVKQAPAPSPVAAAPASAAAATP
jgi:predicted methyltransferase